MRIRAKGHHAETFRNQQNMQIEGLAGLFI